MQSLSVADSFRGEDDKYGIAIARVEHAVAEWPILIEPGIKRFAGPQITRADRQMGLG
jgi:hypothetical protein